MLLSKYETGICLYFDLQVCFLMQSNNRRETSAFTVESTRWSPLYLGPHSTNCWDYTTKSSSSQPQIQTPLDSILLFSHLSLSKGRSEVNPLYRSVRKSGKKKRRYNARKPKEALEIKPLLTLCEWQVKSPLLSSI